jgi:hypothetical protein
MNNHLRRAASFLTIVALFAVGIGVGVVFSARDAEATPPPCINAKCNGSSGSGDCGPSGESEGNACWPNVPAGTGCETIPCEV